MEVHIVDFYGDLYDKEIEVLFLDFIREIKKFDSIEALKAQLTADLTATKEGKYD